MTYEEFLYTNRNKLVGYFLLSNVSTESDVLNTPYPPTELSEERLEEMKGRINKCMPLDSMVTDLWDWDIHFEECLSDDWYFEAVFGPASSVALCSEQLAEFFVQKCDEYGIDYDQSADDPSFENLVREQTANFICGWRNNVFSSYAQPGAPADSLDAASRRQSRG